MEGGALCPDRFERHLERIQHSAAEVCWFPLIGQHLSLSTHGNGYHLSDIVISCYFTASASLGEAISLVRFCHVRRVYAELFANGEQLRRPPGHGISEGWESPVLTSP